NEHGYWLNMAEIELIVLIRQCIARRISNKETLSAEVSSWENSLNNVKVQIDWQLKTDDSLIKLKILYPIINQQYSG
ncbi:MAG: IS630 family transposase, partial [Chloroflexota bacterium]